MNDATQAHNENLIAHIERLANVHQKLMTPRIGGDCINHYAVDEIPKAINRLAEQITTENKA